MKKLFIKDLEINEDINSNININVNIENKEKLRAIIRDYLSDQCESIVIIDDDNKIYNKDEYIEIVTSIYNLEINSKKNLQILNKNIKGLYQHGIEDEIEKLNKIMQIIFEKIRMDYILDVSSDLNITIDEVLKILNLSILESNIDEIEKFILYIKSRCVFNNIRVVVTTDMSFLFSEKEIIYILNEIRKIGVILINIESKANKEFSDIFDKNIIVDKDLFLIK